MGPRDLESAGDIGLEIAFLLSESEEGLESTGLTLDCVWGEAPVLVMVEPCPKVADTQFGDLGGIVMLPKEFSEVAEESIIPCDRLGAETFNQCLDFHEEGSS